MVILLFLVVLHMILLCTSIFRFFFTVYGKATSFMHCILFSYATILLKYLFINLFTSKVIKNRKIFHLAASIPKWPPHPRNPSKSLGQDPNTRPIFPCLPRYNLANVIASVAAGTQTRALIWKATIKSGGLTQSQQFLELLFRIFYIQSHNS